MNLAAGVLLAILAGVSAGTPWAAETRPDGWWMDRHRDFVENTRSNYGTINVLFYGDSITDGWFDAGRDTYDQYYTPLGTANYAMIGDLAENVLWRIRDGEVTGNLNPKLCVIQLGTINLDNDEDETTTAIGVAFNVMELRERLPNTKILLLGLLPKIDEEQTRRTSGVNEIIRHLDNGNTIRYLDMSKHFFRQYEIVLDMYVDDLVNLSPMGYRKWAEVMDPLFREMLNSTSNSFENMHNI